MVGLSLPGYEDDDEPDDANALPPSAVEANGTASPNGAVPKRDESDKKEEERKWETDEEEEDEESRAAISRVLKKYDEAPTFDDDADGGFDARQAKALKEKMDEWKRGYYHVRFFSKSCQLTVEFAVPRHAEQTGALLRRS